MVARSGIRQAANVTSESTNHFVHLHSQNDKFLRLLKLASSATGSARLFSLFDSLLIRNKKVVSFTYYYAWWLEVESNH